MYAGSQGSSMFPTATVRPGAADSLANTMLRKNGVFWLGEDGNVWVAGHQGTHSAGRWDGNTANYWSSRGFSQIANPNPSRGGGRAAGDGRAVRGGGGGYYASGGGGYAAPPKQLDQAQLDSLIGLLSNYDIERDTDRSAAALKRDKNLNEKRGEYDKEEKKYKSKKTSTLQEFAGAKTNTDVNTRNTLENLISSLSTLGMGGSRALARQVLDAANRSNRQANATQAQNTQALDSAWNEFKTANEDDQAKINDQYNYDIAEADRKWGEKRQNTMYKVADVYNAADRTNDRSHWMNAGNSLNSLIANSRFLNPQYTGVARTMDTPDLADYSQDIAQYNTSGIGDGSAGVAGEGTSTPGNLALRAMAVNDKDLGVKKKTEGDLAYGV